MPVETVLKLTLGKLQTVSGKLGKQRRCHNRLFHACLSLNAASVLAASARSVLETAYNYGIWRPLIFPGSRS